VTFFVNVAIRKGFQLSLKTPANSHIWSDVFVNYGGESNVNSEELEVSLRTEFESYLKNVLAEMQQEISQLQEQVSTELDRHKSQLDDLFASAVSKFAAEHNFEDSFKETVLEHLRLARDEGAQITAMAIARAEEMEKEAAPATPSVGVKEIYEAVNDISTKPSQSEILKSLVHHATQFAPRGAFFIVKNEHLVGWRVFGKEKGAAEEKVREVFLPVASDSVLGEAVKNLTTVANDQGGLSADADIFQKLEFGKPNKMVAIPLIARGRGVAVLYADHGSENTDVNIEALETLVRVSGLTVEVLASSKSVATAKKPVEKKADEGYVAANENAFSETGGLSPEVLANYQNFAATSVSPAMAEAAVVEPAYESYTPSAQVVEEKVETTDFSVPARIENDYSEPQAAENPVDDFSETSSIEQDFQTSPPAMEFESFDNSAGFSEVDSVEPTNAFETSSWSSQTEEKVEEKVENEYVSNYSYQSEPEEKYPAFQSEPEEKYPTFENSSWNSSNTEATQSFSAQEFAQNFAKETDPAEYARDFSYQVEDKVSVEDKVEESQPVEVQTEAPVEEFVPTKEQTFEVETTATVATPKSRLSERNVDLPIEVGEDERRLHNDARRFARLLVSEIKLYNEQKVKEGRDANDLYDRLKEAIDRSREMYDKRVQPPVAAKFDYFHYELVNTLAEGDDNKLGSEYPGSMV
jgi:hypothetical protein